MAYDAVLRNLAVIGEAVRALPEAETTAMPQVSWASIAGVRNCPPLLEMSRLRGRARRSLPLLTDQLDGVLA